MWILKLLGILAAVLLLYPLFLFICSLFVSSKKEYDTHSRFYRALLNGATAVALRIMRIRVHTKGVEKLPTDTKNIVFVGNHRSNFDPIISWQILKQWQPSFLSKAGNFKIPIFGKFIHRCCFLEIDRKNPRNALKTINKAAELLKKGEVSIGVYPEGTRSKSGVLLPFHNAVFKTAQKADGYLAIMAIAGTEKIHKNYPFHHTDVYFEVLKVLPPEQVKASKTDALGNYTRELLQQHLEPENTAPQKSA